MIIPSPYQAPSGGQHVAASGKNNNVLQGHIQIAYVYQILLVGSESPFTGNTSFN